MTFLPQNTILGKLEIFEVYGYYDRPCLFSCRCDDGQLFLALWIDETPEYDRWLYAPVSEKVLEGIDTNLRSIFQNAAGDRVFDVTVFSDDKPSSVKMVNCADLTDDMLPA